MHPSLDEILTLSRVVWRLTHLPQLVSRLHNGVQQHFRVILRPLWDDEERQELLVLHCEINTDSGAFLEIIPYHR